MPDCRTRGDEKPGTANLAHRQSGAPPLFPEQQGKQEIYQTNDSIPNRGHFLRANASLQLLAESHSLSNGATAFGRKVGKSGTFAKIGIQFDISWYGEFAETAGKTNTLLAFLEPATRIANRFIQTALNRAGFHPVVTPHQPMQSKPQSESNSSAGVPELKVDSLKFGVMFALAVTAAQRLVGLIRGILFCRFLPEEQLGQWSLTWSYLMLLAPLAVLGLPGSFNRYVEAYRQRGQLRTFLVRISAVSIATTILFSGGLYLAAEPVAHLLYRDVAQAPLVVLIALTLFVVVGFNFAASLMEALRQVRLVTIMRLVNGVTFAILAIALLFVWSNGTRAITLGFVLSCVAGTIPAVIYLSRNWSLIESSRQPLPRQSMWSRVAPFAAWLWVINLVSNLYETADRNMLLHLAPVSTVEAQALVGQYHSGRIIPLVLVGLAAMLSGILMSYMTASWERGDHKKVSQQLRWTLKLTGLGFTVIGAVVLMMAPLLFDYVLQGRFADGQSVLPLTLVYCIWYSLLTVGQDYLWCGEKGKWACLAVVTGLTVNLVLNWFLIPRFGLSGAVWATAISNLAALLALYLINYQFGWRADRGIWLTALLPLALLLPLMQAVVVIAVISWAGIYYGWLLNSTEKDELYQAAGELAKRGASWLPVTRKLRAH